MQDLFKEGMVIPTVSLFNSPIWPILKLGKNKWHLMVQYPNLKALVPHIKAPYPMLLKLLSPSNQHLVNTL